MYIIYRDDFGQKHLTFIQKSDFAFYKERFGEIQITEGLIPPKKVEFDF